MPQSDWQHHWHDLQRHHLRAEWPTPAEDETVLAQRLAQLRTRGLDRLPLPAHGETLRRWAMLADIAGLDLALLKLFEGHTDALAILAELSDPSRFPADACWAVWAAEPPAARLELTTESSLRDGQRVRLHGRKAWCSGAATVTHALVTAWHRQTPCLAAVEMNANGVGITSDGWSAVGMAATRSVEVIFDDVPATLVGGARDYLQRPGFWHGGIGIAACWWGAAARLGDMLRTTLEDSESRRDDPHAFAHLGAVDVALRHGQARLREAAHWIDAHPEAETRHLALSVRAAIDHGVAEVIHHVGRGVGAGPYCRDPLFARLMADLPVFVRQCHAERDLEALGRHLATADEHRDSSAGATWSLWS